MNREDWLNKKVVSAMGAIQVLGKVRMSVFYPILGFLVRKIPNTRPGRDKAVRS
jgi:hypothetical protein